MKKIALLAVVAMLLVDLFGSKSSVGGPLTDLLVAFLIMVAVAVQQASVRKRGVLGWIVNIVASVIGGLVAVSLAGMVVETILTQIHFEGALATSHDPMRYISSAGMAVATVLGSWMTLQVIYWWPDRSGTSPTPVT